MSVAQVDVETPPLVDHAGVEAGGGKRPAGAWWAWLGLHGGAGVTTLAAALPGGVELGGVPADHGYPEMPLVAVCRSHAGGLAAAQEWAAWADRQPARLNLLGLVVMADAPGRLPRPLEAGLRVVAGGYPETWRVPWVPAWRVGQPPTPENLPTAGRQLFHDLAARSGLPLPGGD